MSKPHMTAPTAGSILSSFSSVEKSRAGRYCLSAGSCQKLQKSLDCQYLCLAERTSFVTFTHRATDMLNAFSVEFVFDAFHS